MTRKKVNEFPRPFNDYTNLSHAEFMADIECLFSVKDSQMIDDAYNLSKYGHRNQKRDGGRRYFDHPKEVAIILYREFGVRDKDIIISALLHDIIEDTFILSLEAIERLFGKTVAQRLRVLSKLPKEGYNYRLEEFGDVGAWLIKLADNLHNTRTLDVCTPQKQIRKVKETLTHYFPLIDFLEEKLIMEKKDDGSTALIRALFHEAIDHLGIEY